MKHIQKEYQQSFLLEPTKLQRLVSKIHERLADHPSTACNDNFEVFLAGNRREEMGTLDDVLALDNSRKQKIERLVVVCSASAPGAMRPEHEVQVDFGSPRTGGPPSNSTTRVVAVSVRSDAGAWASRALSEVEEQVERTWIHYSIGYLTILVVLLVAALIVVALSPFVSLNTEAPLANGLWLRSSDANRVEAMLGDHPILTDENLREIATMQLRNVLGLPRRPRSISSNQLTRTLFLVVPISVVVGCFLVLLANCYPSAVFLWGDEVERYANVLQRRRVLWSAIVGITVVGVLSKLLFEGLTNSFPK
jgi:hypothetical protein